MPWLWAAATTMGGCCCKPKSDPYDLESKNRGNAAARDYAENARNLKAARRASREAELASTKGIHLEDALPGASQSKDEKKVSSSAMRLALWRLESKCIYIHDIRGRYCPPDDLDSTGRGKIIWLQLCWGQE